MMCCYSLPAGSEQRPGFTETGRCLNEASFVVLPYGRPRFGRADGYCRQHNPSQYDSITVEEYEVWAVLSS